jgi:hypothetical protein
MDVDLAGLGSATPLFAGLEERFAFAVRSGPAERAELFAERAS